MAKDIRIEYPSAGATYSRDEYGVYEYSFYPERSVLAGQSRRQFLGSFETLREAQAEFPDAVVTEGCGYVAPALNHLPDGPDDLVAGAIGYPKEKETPTEHIRNAVQLLVAGERVGMAVHFDVADVAAIKRLLEQALDGLKDAPNYARPR